ncbi:MAG: endonuclease/exonuclease/phosphatase family protein [Armatimonadetes bacterium]|nr:endonuclease/exonuclease/phosphatase family protein [Armatimonadota bacterium]
MKKLATFLILFSFTFLFADELPKIEYDKLSFGEENTLDVMTWNIQNFPKTEFSIDYAAGVINAIDADIIGLQEIESDSAFVVLLKNLQKQNPEDKWNGFRANTNEWEMNLAYLYKSCMINMDSIYQIYPDDEKYHQPFPRKPLVLEFSCFDQKFFIINNHLKAMPGEKNMIRRKDACRLLDEYIDEFLSDENVILLGDLNDQLPDPEEENVFQVFLNKPEEYKFADWQIAADSTANWSYPYWKYRGHIDHILISNELFDEFANAGSEVKTITIDKFMEGEGDARYKYITDHRPVVLKLMFSN